MYLSNRLYIVSLFKTPPPPPPLFWSPPANILQFPPYARKASFIHLCGCGVLTTHCPFSPAMIMPPKPEGYVDDFTGKCGNLSVVFSKSKFECFGCHGNEIPSYRYFKLGWNTTRFNQSPFWNFLACIIRDLKIPVHLLCLPYFNWNMIFLSSFFYIVFTRDTFTWGKCIFTIAKCKAVQ